MNVSGLGGQQSNLPENPGDDLAKQMGRLHLGMLTLDKVERLQEPTLIVEVLRFQTKRVFDLFKRIPGTIREQEANASVNIDITSLVNTQEKQRQFIHHFVKEFGYEPTIQKVDDMIVLKYSYKRRDLGKMQPSLTAYVRSFLGLDDNIALSKTSKSLKASEEPSRNIMPHNKIASEFVNKLALGGVITPQAVHELQRKIDCSKVTALSINVRVTRDFLRQVATIFPQLEFLTFSLTKEEWFASDAYQRKYTFQDFTHLRHLDITSFEQYSVATYLIESYARIAQGRLSPVPLLLQTFGVNTTQFHRPDQLEAILQQANADFRLQIRELFANAYASMYIRQVIADIQQHNAAIPTRLQEDIAGIANKVTVLAVDIRRLQIKLEKFLDTIASDQFFPGIKVLVIEGEGFLGGFGAYTFDRFMKLEKIHFTEERARRSLEDLANDVITAIAHKTKGTFLLVPNILRHWGKEVSTCTIPLVKSRFISELAEICPKITTVYFREVSYADELPMMDVMQNLRHLYIYRVCHVHLDRIPATVEELNIRTTQPVVISQELLVDLPHVKNFSTSIGTIPAEQLSKILKCLAGLKYLYLDLGDETRIQFLGSLSQGIEELQLDSNSKQLDEEVMKKYFAQFHHLRNFLFEGNGITGACVQAIGSPGLERLDVGSDKFDERVLFDPKLKTLKGLSLGKCGELSQEAIQRIASFPDLVVLDLDDASFNDKTVNLLATMTKLETLNFIGSFKTPEEVVHHKRQRLLPILKERLPSTKIFLS